MLDLSWEQARAISSEVEPGSRRENASNQESRAPFRFVETEMAPGLRRRRRSPAALKSGAEALVRGSERRFADRARYADAFEQFLLGADLAKPFVVGGGQRLAGDQAGAGVGNAQFGGAVDFIISRRMSGHAGHRHRRQVYAVCARQTAMPLPDHVVAVLQGERILLAQGQRLAQGGAELALLLRGIDAGFDRRLVPDRADAGGGDRCPCGPRGLRQAAAV